MDDLNKFHLGKAQGRRPLKREISNNPLLQLDATILPKRNDLDAVVGAETEQKFVNKVASFASDALGNSKGNDEI